ncbi:MAG: FAD-dependent oxidoreductase [Candidatus Paceibacterota bacterium]
MFDLIIIGGGPAGVAAGVYASRKKLHSLLITNEWGGQSIVSPDIQNWIGTPSITGEQLAIDFKTHLTTYANETIEIKEKVCVTDIQKKDDGTFSVTMEDGTTAEARSVLITSGSKRRRLEIPGADEFENKGVTYCASCDGPMFSGQDVAVIGGGNAGFETAAQLLAYAKSVTLLHRSGAFKADPVTVEKVLSHENMKSILNAQISKVQGETFVSGLAYKNEQADEEQFLAVTGIFVEIGMIPNTEFAADVVSLDEYNRIEIDPWTQKTTAEGIWAAGDCTNVRYHQNNISAGDAVRALEDIYIALKTR